MTATAFTLKLLFAAQEKAVLVQELITSWLCWTWFRSELKRFQNCGLFSSKGKCAAGDCIRNFFLFGDTIQHFVQFSMEVPVDPSRRFLAFLLVTIAFAF